MITSSTEAQNDLPCKLSSPSEGELASDVVSRLLIIVATSMKAGAASLFLAMTPGCAEVHTFKVPI